MALQSNDFTSVAVLWCNDCQKQATNWKKLSCHWTGERTLDAM